LLFPRTEPHNHGRTRSDMHYGQAANIGAQAKASRPRRYSSSRKPSQIFNMCAKFFHKSIPRVTVSS
jgi:hypothetical protein